MGAGDLRTKMARPEIKRSVDFSNLAEKRAFFTEAGVLEHRYHVDLSPERDSLSAQQRAYYFACIAKALQLYMQEQEYESVTLEMSHQILKSQCLKVSVVHPVTGEIIGERVQSITELDRPQMAAFMERCRAWLADMLHIVVPDPDPNWAVPPAARSPKGVHAA
jgi:hypothetical protein